LTGSINNSNFYVCSGCRFEKTKITNNLKYKVDNVFQLENIKEKTKETLLKNYGVDHPLKNERIKDKLRKTCFDRYGVENVFQFQKNIDIIQKKSKITRIKNGQQIPDDKLTEWDFYKKKVTSITRKNKKQLFQNWNGFDYYDGEYIKQNFNLKWYNTKHPSIDHKISIYYGFKNKISPEIIGNIDNLCITKRGTNRKKHTQNEKVFLL